MNKTQTAVSKTRQPLLFITMLIGLSACAGTSSVGTLFPPIGGSHEPPPPSEPRQEPVHQPQDSTPGDSRRRKSIPAEDVDFYLEAADQAEGHERTALLIQAAETAYFTEQPEEALEILETIDIFKLPTSQMQRVILLLAELGQFADRPLTLLSKLPPPDSRAPSDLAYRTLQARSQAQLTLGQTLEAVGTMVAQEQYVDSPSELRSHREKIWHTLRSAPPLTSKNEALSGLDRDTRGWVELANVMLDLWLGPQELESAITSWEKQFPDHPAHQTVFLKPFKAPQPRQRPLQVFGQRSGEFDVIALLLPLSGPYAAPAEAVRDGFMTAYYRLPEPRPEIIVFDTGSSGNTVERLAEQALLAGANIIVGPLEKEDVIRMATNVETPVPVLALNYIDQTATDGDNFYQFGLSPEDEAVQVADRALADGRLNALALVPESQWGRRTLSAFQERLTRRGGKLLDVAFYNPSETDFRGPMTRLLRYTGKGEPIREDMDYIFLAAQPQHARLIRPQLRFYRASRVPVYATSHVYSGRVNARQDMDLDGIRFGDMPWILDQDDDLRDARKLAAKLWPESYARLPRLYALGFDAFALATQIVKNNLRPGFGYPAASGVLTLQGDGKISRGLVWAHFSDGLPRLLSDKPPSEEPFEEPVEEIDEEEGYLPEELAQ